jgi:hypothetical protein
MHLEDRGLDRDGYQRWRAVAFFGSDAEGKAVRRSWTFRAASRRAAERAANAWEAQTRASMPRGGRTSDVATMTALAERYFAHLEASGRSPSTLDNYRQKWDTHLKPAIGDVHPREVVATDLNAVYASMRRRKLSPATIRQTHNIASGMLGRAVKWGWLEDRKSVV